MDPNWVSIGHKYHIFLVYFILDAGVICHVNVEKIMLINLLSIDEILFWGIYFDELVIPLIKHFWSKLFNTLWLWVPPLECLPELCIYYEWSTLWYFFKFLWVDFDWIYVSTKLYHFINGFFICIIIKLRWVII